MKTLLTGEEARLQSGAFQACDLVLAELPSGNYGFWFGGQGKITYGGVDYLGCGPLLKEIAIETTADGTVSQYNLELSGLDPEILATVEAEDYHQKPILRQSAYIDEDGVTMLNVRTVGVGRIDFITRNDYPKAKLVVTVTGGSQLVKGRGGRRRTDADQRRLAHPVVDRFFERVSGAGQQTRYWGMKNPIRPSGTQGIGGGGGSSGNTAGPGAVLGTVR
jgi:hypothetical protein